MRAAGCVRRKGCGRQMKEINGGLAQGLLTPNVWEEGEGRRRRKSKNNQIEVF